jgi:hypothetical protein
VWQGALYIIIETKCICFLTSQAILITMHKDMKSMHNALKLQKNSPHSLMGSPASTTIEPPTHASCGKNGKGPKRKIKKSGCVPKSKHPDEIMPGDTLSLKTHTMDEILANLGFWKHSPGVICG